MIVAVLYKIPTKPTLVFYLYYRNMAQQQWSREYFTSRHEYCKSYFATVLVTWCFEFKHLVPEPRRSIIEENFMSIWNDLIALSFHERVSEDVVHFFYEMQQIQDQIWSLIV